MQMQQIWRQHYQGNEHLFVESDGKIYPIVSGGQVETTRVTISAGVANVGTRAITWNVRFNNPGLGFDAADITPTPSAATVTVGGTGNERTVTLTLPATEDLRQFSRFVMSANPFSDRVLISPLADRTSDEVSFYPTTTVTFTSGVLNVPTRSISWGMIFSNAGSGLVIDDLTQRPTNAARTIGGVGNARTVTLKLPGTSAVEGIANFVISAFAFTDRTIIGSNFERRAPNAGYSFPSTIEPVTTRTIDEISSIARPLEDDWQVILGNLDITDSVIAISDITRSLDDSVTYDFRVAEATLTVSNPNGEFSLVNQRNNFVLAGEQVGGIHSSIKIVRGNQIIFTGEVLEIAHEEESGDMRWVITDASLDINDNDVTDFGLEKRIKISPFNPEESSQTGIYPFPTAVSPPSEDSASGIGSSFRETLNFDNALKIEGADTRNVDIVESELHSEGGYFVEGDDPLVTFKSPRRYNSVTVLAHELLEHYGIGKHRVSLANERLSETSFQTMGRVGYATEAGERSGNTLTNVDEWHWKGYVTDFVIDPEGVGYSTRYQGLCEFQGCLYGVTSSNLHRIYPENRSIKDLGNISEAVKPDNISQSGRIAGLASVQDRLFLLTRRDIYQIHISDDDEVSVTRLTLSGTVQEIAGVQRLRQQYGHYIGLTNRGDEMFIGMRQGLQRVVIRGTHADVLDVFPYNSGDRSLYRGNEPSATANSIEYLDGKFYFTTGRTGSAFTSFEMPTGYTAPDTYTRFATTDLDSLYLGTYKGNLIGGRNRRPYLSYINPQNATIIEELTNPTFYFLYSARQSDTTPKVIRYQPFSDTWDVIYDHPTHAEFWQMHTDDFETFYILGGEAQWERGRPWIGAYNTANHRRGATPNTNTIWQLDTSTTPPTLTTLVDSDNAYRPQLAQYYHLGFEGTQNRTGFLPDSRKSIQTDTVDLYYIYAHRAGCGVAVRESNGTTSALITAPLDNMHNECGVDFTINGRDLYAGFTFIDESAGESVLKIVYKSLGDPPRFLRTLAATLTEGSAYDVIQTVTGDPTPTITSAVTTGSLPNGVMLDGARLHGTPTSIPDAGVDFTVTYTATNKWGTVTSAVEYHVSDENASAPSFNAFTANTMTENVAYDQTITATGTPTPVITSSVPPGAMPDGLTLDGARLHGTPTGIDATTTFTVTWTATNSEGAVHLVVTFTVTAA